MITTVTRIDEFRDESTMTTNYALKIAVSIRFAVVLSIGSRIQRPMEQRSEDLTYKYCTLLMISAAFSPSDDIALICVYAERLTSHSTQLI